MKRALTLLGLLACVHAGAQPPAVATSYPSPASAQGSQPGARAPGVHQYTLRNGMQLFVQTDRRAPTAVHMVWVRVGSMDEVDGTSGVAHALEHMMFKGTKTVPPGQFSRRIAALGGQENAFTNRDYTGYYQQIPAKRPRGSHAPGSRPVRAQPMAGRGVQQGDRGHQGRSGACARTISRARP